MCKTCVTDLMNVSTNEKWEQAQKEWYLVGMSKSEENEQDHCICGREIKYLFEFEHADGGSRILGSKCINTIYKDNHRLIEKVNNWTCRYCDVTISRRRKDKHKENKRHKKNVIKNKDKLKKCIDCKEFKINRKLKNHTKCLPCYKNKKLCKTCNKYNINKDSKYRKCWHCSNAKYIHTY